MSSSGQENERAPASTSHGHRHCRRFFIGPLPEKVISLTEAILRKASKRSLNANGQDDEDESLSHTVKQHAYSFFIREGGKAEDWGEHEESSAINEMLKRWGDSDWGKILQRRKKEVPTGQWVGCSFEVGNFLGVNTINNGVKGSGLERVSTQGSRNVASSSSAMGPEAQSSTAALARTILTNKPSHPTLSIASGRESDESAPLNSASSTTPLLKKQRLEPRKELPPNGEAVDPGPQLPPAESTDDPTPSSNQKGKGKERMVHYSDQPAELPQSSTSVEAFAETGSPVMDSLNEPGLQADIKWGDVVLRDRMLVRVCSTRMENLGVSFNEEQNRTTRHLHYENWAEYMVVWRRDCIEIYEDYLLPLKEKLLGHKSLAFVVPLKSSRTHLSMYSFVDLTFCITCPPATVIPSEKKSRSLLRQIKDGTNVFVFKVKSRTRALDWTWKLWRYLGGRIPPSIEIRNPRLGVRVNIDIPPEYLEDRKDAKTMFCRENLIGLCTTALGTVQDWDHVIQNRIKEGSSLELAWRLDTKLDWVWQNECVDGTPRHWAVLCGLALKKNGHTPHLEVRVAEHLPTNVRLQDGTHLDEPASIEGYLDHIKPNSQTKKPVYLVTHDGNLFSIMPSHAHPPSPPGLHTNPSDGTDNTPTSRQAEVRRGTSQLKDAFGVSDLRDILAVRRAFQIVAPPLHTETKSETDSDRAQPQIEVAASDDEDEGGQDGLAKSADKPRVKVKRSFELLLKNGHVVRFEAHSRRDALEWIDRLRALILYWRWRHRIDAREAMEVTRTFRPPITQPLRAVQGNGHLPPAPPQNTAASLSALSKFYNWCVLDGCKPIIKGGKLFVRRGLYGPFKLVQMFLISGYLVLFHISQKSALHHRQIKNISLLDAYICSGYFATLALPQGQFNPTAPVAPRRYQDGLESDDPEEDMLFMIWYRRQGIEIVDNITDDAASEMPVPKKLSSKRKAIFCRTRSKLERDSWCWAVNCEVERIVRMAKAREDKLRATGGIVKI